ncbi:MAG: 3-deoxy-D-manno-octulosonic acid transferase [Gammaproteobacteria bacterium]|nr:MAG: 3-deoxy-D-manno-octulosonic acid transferase [Gammaproteobacteria bacterium]
MARLAYSLLFYLLTPLILVRLLWRSRRAPAYRRRWKERLGWVPTIAASRQVIWVHSVSVGETLAAVPMIRALQQRYPEALLAVTTMTPTGSARVSAEFGDSVYHVYAPYDLPCAVNRFLRRVRPHLLVIMETELWPNLIHYCRQRGTSVVVANARLSEKSAVGYRRFAALTAPMLAKVNQVAAQHQDDGARFQSLGLSDEQLTITGNIKFDLNIADTLKQRAAALRTEWRGIEGRPVWLVASTHAGEEEIVLRAFRQLLTAFPSLLLVLVPRHPERFQGVAQMCESLGFMTVKRSRGDVPGEGDQILLGDTMGELLLFFGACDIAFVGGSLVPVGGHNLIEPAAWEKPVLSGPHLFNFSEASRLLLEAGGMAVCADDQALVDEITRLLESPESAAAMAAAAKSVADNNRGALQRLLDVIERQLSSH